MKTTVKNISLLFTSLFLIGSLTTATAQRTALQFTNDAPGTTFLDPVQVIHQNIANLEMELETLRMEDKRALTKSEKRMWRKKKRFTRRKLSQQYDMLSRLTAPLPGYGYYGSPYGYRYGNYNPYRTNRVVVIQKSRNHHNHNSHAANSHNNGRRNTTTTTTTTTTRKPSVQGASTINRSVKHSAKKLKP